MLDLIARFKHVIKSFHISLHEQEGEILRFKAQLTFIDDSTLFIKEYICNKPIVQLFKAHGFGEHVAEKSSHHGEKLKFSPVIFSKAASDGVDVVI